MNAASGNLNFGDRKRRLHRRGQCQYHFAHRQHHDRRRRGGFSRRTSTTDHFGFSAQQIGSFKAGGYTAPLTTGPANNIIEFSPVTGDVTIREVA